MKVTVEKVTKVAKAELHENGKRVLDVYFENNDCLPTVEVDYIDVKQGELVFYIPQHSLVPFKLSNMFKLNRTKAVEDKYNEGYVMLVSDVVLPVKSLYPTPPRKPGSKDRLDISVDGKDYSWLLGVKFPDLEQHENDFPSPDPEPEDSSPDINDDEIMQVILEDLLEDSEDEDKELLNDVIEKLRSEEETQQD